MSEKLVYIHLANGFEEVEALTTCDYLRRANIDAKLVSMEDLVVTGAHGIKITCDLVFDQADYQNADCLCLPGGMPGTTNLMNHQGLCQKLFDHHNAGKTVAAICAAPMVLGHLGIIKGKEATIYPGMDEYLIDAKYVDQKVVCCDNVITSRGPATAVDFALAIIANLLGQEASDAVAKDITLIK